MSSKLVRGDNASGAAPISWRPANGVSAQTSTGNSMALGGPEASRPEKEQQAAQKAQAAYQQGFAAGEAASAQRLAQKIEPAVASLTQMVQELASVRKKFRAEAEADTVKLAIAIARRVLHRELTTDPEAILGFVKMAYEKLNAREIHRLRVSPSDSAILLENRARLQLSAIPEIVEDNSLRPGSAIFETSRGDLDASIETQLSEIDRGFADLLKRRNK